MAYRLSFVAPCSKATSMYSLVSILDKCIRHTGSVPGTIGYVTGGTEYAK